MKRFFRIVFRCILSIFLLAVAACAAFRPQLTVQVEQRVPVSEKIIDVPAICQHPTLPTGCESVAATMVLQYYGVSVTAEEFAGEWLVWSEKFYVEDNKLYGPDPNEEFVGNPFTDTAHGCFATPIVNAVNEHCDTVTAEQITVSSLEQLCTDFIQRDTPVLVWATVDMKAPTKGHTWILPNGAELNWQSGQHCLVLVGYTEDSYLFNDPTTGTTVAYPKEIAEQRFAAMGKQAVCVKN